MFFNKKYKITLLKSNDWLIFDIIKVKELPRKGELIYINNDKYYSVVNVIYNVAQTKKINYFVIIEELIKKDSKTLDNIK